MDMNKNSNAGCGCFLVILLVVVLFVILLNTVGQQQVEKEQQYRSEHHTWVDTVNTVNEYQATQRQKAEDKAKYEGDN